MAMQRIALVLLAGLSVPAVHAQDWAKARLEKSPRHHDQVGIQANGSEIPTFIVYPEAKAKRPVILLIAGKTGVDDWFKSFTDEVAGMGYIALAPRITAESQATADLNVVADYALKLPPSNGMLFVAGVGWGGEQSFRFAAERPDLAAALVFCGASPDKDAIAKIKGSVFGFYAANDPAVDATVPPAQAAARAAGVVFEAVTYKDVGPEFLESGDAPDAKQTDKLAHGYAMERMKSVLDMVALRGY
jgi:carboxymethylenebutenolidase